MGNVLDRIPTSTVFNLADVSILVGSTVMRFAAKGTGGHRATGVTAVERLRT